MHSYKLPGLDNYRFNGDGDCRRIVGFVKDIKLTDGSYTLMNDLGECEVIALKEVLKYISHIKLKRSKILCVK